MHNALLWGIFLPILPVNILKDLFKSSAITVYILISAPAGGHYSSQDLWEFLFYHIDDFHLGVI